MFRTTEPLTSKRELTSKSYLLAQANFLMLALGAIIIITYLHITGFKGD